MTDIALRPYLPADAPALIDIFRDSIELLTQDEYDEDQRGAWASAADDEEAFAGRLGKALTILATIDGDAVGFASLQGADKIDLLYVEPSLARHGVGTALIDALEKLGAARGANRITADVSDSARPFFEKRGYVAQTRNTVEVNGEWLTNTTMTRQLAANEAGTAPASETRH